MSKSSIDMTKKITARIEKAKGNALWLFIDRVEGKKTKADDLKDYLGLRSEDSGNVAYAVLEEELIPIKLAIEVYLEKEDLREIAKELLKDSIK